MKKVILFFAVIFASVSSTFAYYVQGIWADPSQNYSGMTVNINATCEIMKIECSWNGVDEDSGGAAQAYSDILIGEYSIMYDGQSNYSYSQGIWNRYWGTVYVYLYAYACNGEARLIWDY